MIKIKPSMAANTWRRRMSVVVVVAADLGHGLVMVAWK